MDVSSRRLIPAAFLPLTLAITLVLAGCAGASGSQAARAALRPVASVNALSVAQGTLAGGETVAISGANLSSVTRVMFGSEEATSVRVIDNSTVDVVVPHSYTYTVGPVPVKVFVSTQTPAVASTTDLEYSYQALTDVDRQLEYAFAHWDNYNLAQYGDFTAWGGDCMDFVSQTLVARGWATTDDWFNDAQQEWAPAFVDVPSFDEWLSAHPEYGATRHTLADRDELKIGDIVMFDWDNDGSLDHAQIVSGVTVVDGETKIFLVGHDIDTHYRDLDEALKTEGGPDATAFFWSLPSS
jgi:hypothetical protein